MAMPGAKCLTTWVPGAVRERVVRLARGGRFGSSLAAVVREALLRGLQSIEEEVVRETVAGRRSA